MGMGSDRRGFVERRLNTLRRTPGFVDGHGATRKLEATWDRGAALGLRGGVAGPSQLVFFHDPMAWFGGPVTLGWLDGPVGAPLEPLAALIDAHHDALGPDSLIECPTDDRPLIEMMIARGFGIDSVIQVGDARHAARVIGAGPLPPGVEPLGDEHIAGVIALHREVFSAEPEWCWFGAAPAHLQRMAEDLARASEGHFVLVEDGAVVGHIGAELRADDFWGPTGGLELVLARRLRGRGLARSLYRVALRSLVARGARTIKGGTSQPAVLALGRALGRSWHAFNLRRGVRFAPDHFLRWL